MIERLWPEKAKEVAFETSSENGPCTPKMANEVKNNDQYRLPALQKTVVYASWAILKNGVKLSNKDDLNVNFISKVPSRSFRNMRLDTCSAKGLWPAKAAKSHKIGPEMQQAHPSLREIPEAKENSFLFLMFALGLLQTMAKPSRRKNLH